MGEQKNIQNFYNLPGRIFLDSNILQILHEYGEELFNNTEISREDRNFKNIEALRDIFFVAQRAQFEFALSKNSLKEVSDAKNVPYLEWTYEMLDYWMCCLEAYKNTKAFSGEGRKLLKKLNEAQFSYLSKKDKELIFDSVALECAIFLTMDKHLWKNKKHLETRLGIKVLQPFEYWELLKPWAALWI